ncbi:MAG: FHA domain-containing protein [Spartobacteria bacterium]|nr:FHA domain-containing protein [Spartobacteria bacterium]
MLLHYLNPDNNHIEVELQEQQSVNIGRSKDCDICVKDEKSSRHHCGVGFQDGQYFLRDLKSKNGTYLNGKLINDTVTALRPGDQIRIGSSIISVLHEHLPGPTTVFVEIDEKSGQGKGYRTIMKEFVQEAEEKSTPDTNA